MNGNEKQCYYSTVDRVKVYPVSKFLFRWLEKLGRFKPNPYHASIRVTGFFCALRIKKWRWFPWCCRSTRSSATTDPLPPPRPLFPVHGRKLASHLRRVDRSFGAIDMAFHAHSEHHGGDRGHPVTSARTCGGVQQGEPFLLPNFAASAWHRVSEDCVQRPLRHAGTWRELVRRPRRKQQEVLALSNARRAAVYHIHAGRSFSRRDTAHVGSEGVPQVSLEHRSDHQEESPRVPQEEAP